MGKHSKLSRSISGSVAFITGAASGMGRATALLFADEGASVALVDINEQALQALTQQINEEGGKALAVPTDCSNKAAVMEAVQHSAKHFGRMDILVNNAGFALPGAFGEEDFDSSWEKSLAVMVNAQQWAVRAALPWLHKAEHPRIVNIASTEALGATNYNSAYVVAKHASLGLTRALAVELGKAGITVNCVCPGPIETGITQGIPDQDKQTFANRRTALRRYGQPEEVAHITLSLVLPAASFITGATIPVDGGLTIRNA
ncbi:MAG: SDR family NAD(P)-dependent oxidoreductase [Halioglobus sp.]